MDDLKEGDVIQILDPRAGWQNRIFVRWDNGFPVCSYPNMTWEPTMYLEPWRIKK